MGKEVAGYLADKVLAWDPEARVSAGDFGRWVTSLGAMLGGAKKIALPTGGGGGGGRKPPVRTPFFVEKKKVEPLQKTTSSLFAKSPVLPRASFGDSFSTEIGRTSSPSSIVSTLTNSAPTTAPSTPNLVHSAPVSVTSSDFDKSPPVAVVEPLPANLPAVPVFPRRDSFATDVGTTDAETDDPGDVNEEGEAWSRSASGTSKRKKRGARKGKAALLAANGPAAIVIPPTPAAAAPAVTVIDATPTVDTGLAGLASLGVGANGLFIGGREATGRALALASQTLAREISAMTTTRPSVCMAPAGYEYRSSAFPPSHPNGGRPTSNSPLPASPGSGATTRTPSSTRKQTELEVLRALAREREDAAAAMGLGKDALAPWPRGRPSERDSSPPDVVQSEVSRRRGTSPSNSVHSSIHSAHSHQSRSSAHHPSESASWRQPPGASPHQPINPASPNQSGSTSAPAVPTRRDAGSGAVPGTRRILVARRTTDTVPARAQDPSPGRTSARTSVSASSPPSSIYSRASDSSVSTYATSASSSGSFQPNSSRGSSLASAGGTPIAAKRQTNVKRESLPNFHDAYKQTTNV